MTKLFVGNLPVSATNDSLGSLFSAHGAVESVELVIDRQTGVPRGFGFVEMAAADAARAIEGVHGHEFEGRALKVNEAEDRPKQGEKRRGSMRRY
jgi:RNA recognition motif-containing protein